MENEEKPIKKKRHPFRTLFQTERDGFKAYFVNAKYVLVPVVVFAIAVTAFFALRFLGLYISENDFANQANAALEASGEATRVPTPTFAYLWTKTFEGLTIDADLNQMVTTMGLSDGGLKDSLVEQIKHSVAANNVCSFLGLSILLISLFLASAMCGKKIKKANNVTYGLKYTIISLILKVVVFSALLTGLTYLFNYLPWASAIVSIVLIPFFQSLFALWRAYMVQMGLKKTLGMFRTITPADAFMFLLLTWGIYLIFGTVFVVLMSVLPKNIFLILSFALPLFVYTSCFLDVYAEIYILKKGQLQKKDEAPQEGNA